VVRPLEHVSRQDRAGLQVRECLEQARGWRRRGAAAKVPPARTRPTVQTRIS
jgi:hypothetical protein